MLMVVIEDNPADVKLFRLVLEGSGLASQVLAFSSGAEALRYLDEVDRPPDLITVDANLPGLQAEQVIRALKGRAPLKQVPVVVLSGMSDPRLATKLVSAGASLYVNKPMDLDGWQGVAREIRVLLDERRGGATSTSF